LLLTFFMRVGPIRNIPDKSGPTLETGTQFLGLTIDTGQCLVVIFPKALPEYTRMDLSMATPDDYTIHGSIC